MRWHRTRTPLALAAVVGLVAACGNGAGDDTGAADDANGTDDTGAAAPAEAQEGDEITVWIMQPGSDEIEALLQGYTDEFEEETGATVNLQFVPWAQAHDQFTTAIAGNETPDVAEMGTTWTAEFGDLGVFRSQEAQVGEDEYVEAVVESGRLEGEALGLPWYAGARALLYRTDVFDDLGLEPPSTWDELIEVGQTIQEETDLFPFAVNTSVHQYLPLVWHAGGEIAEEVEPGRWEARINEPEGVDAFDHYASLLRDHDFAPSGALNWNAGDARAAFFNEEAAMLVGLGIDISISLAENPDLEGSIGVVPNPEGPGGDRSPFAGGSHLVVFEESDAPETAQAYVEFLLDADRVSEFAEAVGFFPGTIDGIEAMDLDDNEQALADALLEARTYPPHPAWGAFEGEELFVNAMQEIMQGSDPQEVLDGVAERMNQGFED
jgi:N,N'-diacetylchitobiose transport system substrate-binding protein